MSEGGTKKDNGKPRISLIPKEATWGCAAALTFGASKYGQYNFMAGLKYSRLMDAALRHITQYQSGENTDPESGLSHLDHAMASLAMLKFMEARRPDMDDRYKEPTTEAPGVTGEHPKREA